MLKMTNIKWNFIGLVAPLVIAAFSVPALIERLGEEKFGVLALCWAMIGYASVIDFGVGRAVTQKVSELKGGKEEKIIPSVVTAARKATGWLGIAGFCIILTISFFDIRGVIGVEDLSRIDLSFTIILLAIAMPVQALSATYRGLNEAYLNFREISLVRMFIGVVNFGGPLVISYFSTSISMMVMSLTLSRIICYFFYKNLSEKCLKNKCILPSGSERYSVKELISFGGWVTLSSVVNPFFLHASKFYLAGLISASSVTIFAIPFEVTIQLLVFATVVSTVAFPTVSAALAYSSESAVKIFKNWMFRLSVFLLFVCILWFFSAPLVMEIWLGDSFKTEFVLISRIIVVGVFFNGLATLVYAYVHAAGYPKWTAISHVFQFFIFISVLYPIVSSYGAVGAAVTWTLRVVLDFVLLYIMFIFLNRRK
ncbi:oligosaccharide flippase family protein [Halomonas sp.]|uniref:oligosaccharide flippase family protein n=1 Tax=Halomonas sp. TaxID=1486246 RepID=UPI000C98483D|nr:oligosaccharide flippase family protein [Halomonas sp.]MAR70932.1 hypothetical protein [Halomonas sp.]|tara:strand:- start:568 stop:1842 length:1275 start_codon:yes stop_codon:yes gene_type:complete